MKTVQTVPLLWLLLLLRNSLYSCCSFRADLNLNQWHFSEWVLKLWVPRTPLLSAVAIYKAISELRRRKTSSRCSSETYYSPVMMKITSVHKISSGLYKQYKGWALFNKMRRKYKMKTNFVKSKYLIHFYNYIFSMTKLFDWKLLFVLLIPRSMMETQWPLLSVWIPLLTSDFLGMTQQNSGKEHVSKNIALFINIQLSTGSVIICTLPDFGHINLAYAICMANKGIRNRCAELDQNPIRKMSAL